MKITSQNDLEKAIDRYGILPFFSNNISGFSIEEMAPPSLLFGGNEFDGCWEWKGPVVRRRLSAYGKFFKKKAGYVSLELLPHFLNLRRKGLTVKPGSQEEMLLDIISVNDAISSTELRASVLGIGPRKRTAVDLPSLDSGFPSDEGRRPSRHALEGPLQRLQMGGRICISDFIYKQTKRGEKYGWGVAVYSTPESLFPTQDLATDVSPERSLEIIIEKVNRSYPSAGEAALKKLLQF